MTILLTGGAGFIGSHLADRMLAEGHRVVNLDCFDDFYDPEIKRNNISGQLGNSFYKLYQGDIRDQQVLLKVFSENKFDAVVHVAARAGIRQSIKFPQLFFETNVLGTFHLLETMKDFGVKRLLFASSSSVYGNNKSTPFKETDNVDNPISPYAASKKAGELICYNYHNLYAFDVFCLRFFTVYGPRQRPEMAIHYFTECIENGIPINLFGDGTSRRDYTYIDDIVSGVMNALDRLKEYEIINLGESSTISLIDLVKIIETATGKKAIINWLPAQPGDVETTFADISKARRLIGYQPAFSVEEGIKKFVHYYRKNHSVKARITNSPPA